MRLRSFCMTFFASCARCYSNSNLRLRKIAVSGLVPLLALTFTATASATEVHNLAELQKSVERFLQQYYADTDAVKLEITVGSLDRRLQLTHCEQHLSMKVNDTKYTGGNLTVHTACEGAQPWSIYVPAQVALFRRSPVASRNLERGDIITSADISHEVINISQLRQGQIDDYNSILGKEIKRPIAQGEAFRSAALDSPMVIKRGDLVNIETQAGAISVVSQGTAMSQGRIGDRIRVRNSQSDRIVHAEVLAGGKVQITL